MLMEVRHKFKLKEIVLEAENEIFEYRLERYVL